MFRVLGTPLRWSLLFAFSAPVFVGSRSSRVRTQTRTEPREAQKLSTGAAKGRTGAMHNGGGCGLESALMHSPLPLMVTAQKPHRIPVLVGLRLCEAPIACLHRSSQWGGCIDVSKSIPAGLPSVIYIISHILHKKNNKTGRKITLDKCYLSGVLTAKN